MDEIYIKKFDEIRKIIENDLYNSLFVVWRDDNYKIDFDYAISSLEKIKNKSDELKKIILENNNHNEKSCITCKYNSSKEKTLEMILCDKNNGFFNQIVLKSCISYEKSED